MKSVFVLGSFLVIATAACGGTASSGSDVDTSPDNDITKDTCAKSALKAAEAEYGNTPDGTKVKALTKGVKYVVTVGIGNEEDGAHDYYATFASGCSSKPSIAEVPFLSPPLQAATHAAYDAIIHANNDEMASSYEVAHSALPAAAKKQLDSWTANGPSICSAVTSYKVRVSGQDTFAVTCDTRMRDSIHFHLGIWDASGLDIDQAAIYGKTSGVVDQGVSWQGYTFEEPWH